MRFLCCYAVYATFVKLNAMLPNYITNLENLTSTEKMMNKLNCEGQSVQNALNDLGVDSQVPSAPATKATSTPTKLHHISEDCSKEIGDETGDSEDSGTVSG